MGGDLWKEQESETYRDPRRVGGEAMSTEDIVFDTPDGELRMVLVKAQGVGLVDFAIIPHVDYVDHQDIAIAEKWAARIPAPTYAIYDQTAIKVTDGNVEVVSEGRSRKLPVDPRGDTRDLRRNGADVLAGPMAASTARYPACALCRRQWSEVRRGAIPGSARSFGAGVCAGVGRWPSG